MAISYGPRSYVVTNGQQGRATVVEVDGYKYRITIERFESNAGFAEVLVEDMQTNERFQSSGQIQVNGHTIVTKWGTEYDLVRDNYITTRDLNILVF